MDTEVLVTGRPEPAAGAPGIAGRPPLSKVRRAAVIALDSALAFGTGAVAGMMATGPASAAPATPGWAPLQSPAPSGPDAQGSDPQTYLGNETCTSAVSCVAVGDYGDSSGHERGLLDTFSGGSWTATEAPLPANAAAVPYATIYSVSCPSDGSCVAVGGYKDGSGDSWGVIETLAGGHWFATEAPQPPDAATGTNEDSWLKGVSCPTVGNCVAVGNYKDTSGAAVGLIDTFSGGQWTAVAAPQPAAASTHGTALLELVSCPSSNNCVAEGAYINPSDYLQGDVLQESNGAWTAEDAPLPSNAGTQGSLLESLSCAAGSCVVGGTYSDTGGQGRGLIDRLSGGVWTPTETPEPANAGTGSNQDALLSSMSCTPDGGCTGAGKYADTSGESRGLIETLTGGVWIAQEAPQPPDAGTGVNQDTSLNSVSCVAVGDCTVVGSYLNSSGSGNDIGLIDTESGSTWSALTAPQTPDAATGTPETSGLNTVSCTDRGACDAAGWYRNTVGSQFGLLEAYTPNPGYWEVAGDGGIFSFGNAQFHGSMGGKPLNEPIVGMAPTPGDGGYWEVASDGGMFSFGNAQFYGSMGGKPLNEPIVGMAATPDGLGYWLVASDGGIFAFGDAQFYGSMGGKPLNKQIVGITATPDGLGYWLVASDGGIFAFGDAQFYGSMGGKPLNQPIVGIAANVTGKGYWEVASDGGMFSFGDTQFYGSMGGKPLNKPIVGLMTTFDGGGYWELATDGGIFAFGDAAFDGSMGGSPLNSPVVNGAPT
jgi:hypothetical protein